MGIPYAEVIGDPIAHSKSPAIHKFWLGKLGIEGDYRAVRVPAEGIAAYFDSRRADEDWRGCSVTLPHKQSIARLLDEIRISGTEAVNCVVRRPEGLIGFNTDSCGVGAALPERIDTRYPICIIGAGGAAGAAVATLDILAVFQFNFIVRDAASAEPLASAYGEWGNIYGFEDAPTAMRGCVGLINATPLGMDGFDPMPEPVLSGVRGLRRGAFVLDMVYTPLRTDLLRAAEREGVQAVDGLTMLIGQAREAFQLFFGAAASPRHDAELRELLTR